MTALAGIRRRPGPRPRLVVADDSGLTRRITADALGKSQLDIGARNEEATRAALKKAGIPVLAAATAGNKGRTVAVYIAELSFTAKEAGGREAPLFGRKT